MSAMALPARLPAGERVLWQGTPDWRALARNAMHVRGIAIYCGAMVAWVAGHAIMTGQATSGIAWDTGRALLAACVPVVLAAAYAWAAARGAAYTITNRRVVLRMGVAMPMAINLPFTQVEFVCLRMHKDGSGDIALRMLPAPRSGLSWFILWPHARPWRLGRPEPMLRGLLDAEKAGQVLARAVAAAADAPAPVASASDLVDSGRRQHGAHTVAA